jgi:hypothetical protein
MIFYVEKVMPEVPDAQAPSTEEVKLSNEPQPQPSEVELDRQTVESAPSEGGNVVPVEPVEGLEDPQSKDRPYKEGDSFSFTAPNGESYSIAVVKVEGDQITLQNSTPGTEPIELSLKAAQEILESPARD